MTGPKYAKSSGDPMTAKFFKGLSLFKMQFQKELYCLFIPDISVSEKFWSNEALKEGVNWLFVK